MNGYDDLQVGLEIAKRAGSVHPGPVGDRPAHLKKLLSDNALWHISGYDQDATTVHGTEKPVECIRRPMLSNSSPGQAALNPLGSGTTLIAAETTGRVCFGMESNPVYVDVAVERW